MVCHSSCHLEHNEQISHLTSIPPPPHFASSITLHHLIIPTLSDLGISEPTLTFHTLPNYQYLSFYALHWTSLTFWIHIIPSLSFFLGQSEDFSKGSSKKSIFFSSILSSHQWVPFSIHSVHYVNIV